MADIDAGATRRLTPCGAGRMVWRVWGAGPPLVLLHGATGSWTYWILNIPALAARFQVVVPDMPGYGDSDLPPGPHRAHGLADIVSAGLEVVVAPPAPLALAGFSFGGIIAGLVAAHQGACVRTPVLLGPNGMALSRAPLPTLRRVRTKMTPDEVRETHCENLRLLMLAGPARADDLAVHVQMENVRTTSVAPWDGSPSSAHLCCSGSGRARLVPRLGQGWGGRAPLSAPRRRSRPGRGA